MRFYFLIFQQRSTRTLEGKRQGDHTDDVDDSGKISPRDISDLGR